MCGLCSFQDTIRLAGLRKPSAPHPLETVSLSMPPLDTLISPMQRVKMAETPGRQQTPPKLTAS